jgi:hypothetical protein
LRIKERLMGLAMGLVLTLVGMTGFTFFFSDEGIWGSFQILYIEGKLGSLISLGALLNLPVFFLFIKQYRYDRAYGLVSFSLLLVGIIALLKFL